MSRHRERLLLGAGPIGLFAAAQASEGPHPLRCVATREDAPWLPNYGLWGDDAERLGLGDMLRATLGEVEVHLADGRVRKVPRRYGFLRNRDVQQRLLSRSEGRWHRGTVAALRTHAGGVAVELTGGATLEADLLLDARGAAALPGAERLPAQTAFGVELELPAGHPGFSFRFMDWSFPTPAGEPPSFLYLVPMGPGRIFVEETVLAASPAFPVERLRQRLDLRLASLGLGQAVRFQGTEERCFIPMGALPPAARGPVIPIGAAAGWVHPASGYLLGHGIGWARNAAAAAASGSPASAVWDAVWPADRRRMWALYNFGLEVLLAMKREEISDFFESFFALPDEQVQRYLSATGSAAQIAATMWRLFLDAPWSLRRRLAAPGISSNGIRLLRELSGA